MGSALQPKAPRPLPPRQVFGILPTFSFWWNFELRWRSWPWLAVPWFVLNAIVASTLLWLLPLRAAVYTMLALYLLAQGLLERALRRTLESRRAKMTSCLSPELPARALEHPKADRGE